MSRRRQIGVSCGGEARNSSAEAYVAGVKPPARSRRPSAFRSPASSSMRTTRGGEVVAIRATTTIGQKPDASHCPLGQSGVFVRLDVQFRSEPDQIEHRAGAGLFHYVVAMRLDRPFGGAEVEGDLFVQLPADQMSEHLTLAGCELVVLALDQLEALAAGSLVRVARHGPRDCAEQRVFLHRLGQEI